MKRQLMAEKELEKSLALEQTKNYLWSTLQAYANVRLMVTQCSYTRTTHQYTFLKRLQYRCLQQLTNLDKLSHNDRRAICKQISKQVAGLELAIHNKRPAALGEWIAKSSAGDSVQLARMVVTLKRLLRTSVFGKPSQQSLFSAAAEAS